MPKTYKTYKEMEAGIKRGTKALKAKQAARRAKVTKRKSRVTAGANRIEDAFQSVARQRGWIDG